MLNIWASCVCYISPLSLSHTRHSVLEHVHLSTVTAFLQLSDPLTFERYPVVSAVVEDLATVATSKVTDRLAVWDEDENSFDDFAAQCLWYRDDLRESERRLATAHVVRLFAAKGGKTWNLIQRRDNRYVREWFELKYLLWRIREEICRPALKRNKQDSMSAWASREEKVYLQTTRALARLESNS